MWCADSCFRIGIDVHPLCVLLCHPYVVTDRFQRSPGLYDVPLWPLASGNSCHLIFPLYLVYCGEWISNVHYNLTPCLRRCCFETVYYIYVPASGRFLVATAAYVTDSFDLVKKPLRP